MPDDVPPSKMPRLGVWRLALAAAPQPLLQRRDRPFDPDAPVTSVPEALRYVSTARATLRGPLALELEGPGDPLASAESILRILALVHEHHPDVQTGLVIDGPLLAEYCEELADFGVSYLVVRLDVASQRVAERLIEGARYRGETLDRARAAELYLEDSRRALEHARQAGIAVAVRITLMPTINDLELEALAKIAAEGGAQRLEVRAPLHDERNPFLRACQPTEDELEEARWLAAQTFEKHASPDRVRGLLDWLAPTRFRDVDLDTLDAVDILRTLPSPEELDAPPGRMLPPRRAQLIAVATQDGVLVDLPLGRATNVHVFAVGERTIRLLGTRSLGDDPRRRHDGIGHAPAFLKALMGCRAIVATGFSARATTLLQAVGIRPIVLSGRVDEVLDRVARGTVGSALR